MFLYYVRHGDPIYDPDSLTPLGKRQAEAISHRLSVHGLDEIYVSSSNRAIMTAQPTCEILKKEPVVLDWTNEKYAWEQLTTETNGRLDWGFHTESIRSLFTTKEMRSLGNLWYEHPVFEGTQYKEGYLRIRKETHAFLASQGFVFDEEKGQYRNCIKNDKRVALFAHQGFGLAFLSCVMDIPYPEVCTKMDMTHSGMTVIWFDPDKEYVIPCILELSNDSHLYKDGLPTKYANRFYV